MRGEYLVFAGGVIKRFIYDLSKKIIPLHNDFISLKIIGKNMLLVPKECFFIAVTACIYNDKTL